MSFSEVSDDIPVQPPVGGIGFIASGSIYKGQAVYICSNNTVKAPTDDNQILYGIAGYNKVDGDKIMVYGVGDLVRSKVSSSTTLTAGTLVGCIAGGYLSDTATYRSGAIITKSATSNYGDVEVLILGHGYSL